MNVTVSVYVYVCVCVSLSLCVGVILIMFLICIKSYSLDTFKQQQSNHPIKCVFIYLFDIIQW